MGVELNPRYLLKIHSQKSIAGWWSFVCGLLECSNCESMGRRGSDGGPGVPMIVMKFGGISIESAGAIERTAKIVASRRKRLPMVVVNAKVKVTDQLVPWGRRRRAEIAMPRSSYTNTFFPRP